MKLTRLDQLVTYVATVAPIYRRRNGLVFDAPITLSFVVEDSHKKSKIHVVEHAPATGQLNDVYYYRGMLAYVSQESPFMLAQIVDFAHRYKSSIIPVDTVFNDYFTTFVKMEIIGPDVISTKSPQQYDALLTFLTEAGPVSFSTDDVEFSSTSGNLSPEGLYQPPTIYTTGSDTITVKYAGTLGRHFASKSVLLNANSLRKPTNLQIYGPEEIDSGRSSQFIAALLYDDGTSEDVSCIWSVSADWAEVTTLGSVTVGAIPADATLNLSATASVDGVTFDSKVEILVRNTAVISGARCRYGILTQSTLTQEVFDTFTVAAVGTRQFSFTTKTGIGERVWLVVPVELGSPTVVNVETNLNEDWSPPVILTIKDGGVDVRYYVTYSQFDNLGLKSWRSV